MNTVFNLISISYHKKISLNDRFLSFIQEIFDDFILMEEGKVEVIHTSDKLRSKAVDIIREMGRPMAASEIEIWLRLHNSELWEEVSKKCDDYVRIILSISQEGQIVKYRPMRRIQGIDKRATFFGLVSENYDPNQWLQIGHTTAPKKKTKLNNVSRKQKNKEKNDGTNDNESAESEKEQVIQLNESSDEFFQDENECDNFFSIASPNSTNNKVEKEQKPVSQEKTYDFAKLNSIFDGLANDEGWFQLWSSDATGKIE